MAMVILMPVFADQYAYLRPEIAKRAEALLRNEKEVLLFCEPCGEPEGQVEKILVIATADVNYEGHLEVRINNKGVDLAYVFIRRGDKWKNVAALMRLKTYAVSGEISATTPGKPLPGY